MTDTSIQQLVSQLLYRGPKIPDVVVESQSAKVFQVYPPIKFQLKFKDPFDGANVTGIMTIDRAMRLTKWRDDRSAIQFYSEATLNAYKRAYVMIDDLNFTIYKTLNGVTKQIVDYRDIPIAKFFLWVQNIENTYRISMKQPRKKWSRRRKFRRKQT